MRRVIAIFSKSYKQVYTKGGFLLFSFLIIVSQSKAQLRLDSIFNKLDPQKFAASVSKKAQKLEDKLVAKSSKVLDKLQKEEEKLYRKMLSTKDSLQAKAALEDIKGRYSELQDRLKNPNLPSVTKHYIPRLDSFSTALSFLDKSGVAGNIKDALSNAKSLQDKFQQAEEIKKFIRQRKEQLKQQFEKLGMVKQLKQINKRVYYYSQQITEYKNILNDPKKIEKKALELLSKTKIWKDFFRKNSMLASLFRMPGDPNDPAYTASLAGLQTRVQVNSLIQNQIAAGGPNAMQQFQQNLQSAQSQLSQLKDKVLKFGGGSSDAAMPEGFKPNNQKTKSFFQRLEYGTNIQSQKATSYFPVTSDIGLSVGYRLNDKSIVGIGASYKLGLGKGWNNIRFSSEGVSLRSYMDWKIKGSFWITGGYEQNYRTAFQNFSQLRNKSGWQQSGLIGIQKKLSVKTKFFKQTSIRLLWDFMSYQQVPRTQPVVFRIGYNF